MSAQFDAVEQFKYQLLPESQTHTRPHTGGFDGRSKPASQQTKNAENNTGGSNFDPACHEERF